MERSDVIILGGGLVGLALAAALDSSGLCAAIVDPADPDSAHRTPGSTAAPRAVLLVEADVRHGRHQRHFPEPGCPIRRIEVADGLAPGGLAFEPQRRRRAARAGCTRIATCARRCAARAEAGKQSTLHWNSRAATVERGEFGVTVSLDDGRGARAPLLVAAEGRNSPTREAAGIRVARWKYDHAAIVSTLRHELPHDQVAHEIFYPAGPFALLPMNDDEGGHRSAIVWSVPARRRARPAVARATPTSPPRPRRRWAASSARSR